MYSESAESAPPLSARQRADAALVYGGMVAVLALTALAWWVFRGGGAAAGLGGKGHHHSGGGYGRAGHQP